MTTSIPDLSSITISVNKIQDVPPLYEARIKQLPDAVDFGSTWQEAFELAVDTAETTAEILSER